MEGVGRACGMADEYTHVRFTHGDYPIHGFAGDGIGGSFYLEGVSFRELETRNAVLFPGECFVNATEYHTEGDRIRVAFKWVAP